MIRCGCKNCVEIDGSEGKKDAEYTECKSKIANTVDDKGLYGSGIGRWLVIPESDQEI